MLQEQFIQTLRQRLDLWGIVPDEARLNKLFEFYMLVDEANKVMNLTAITSPEESAIKHFADALNPQALKLLEGCESVIDIGTGAGFPGIPLAIWFADKHFTLMDSTAKRIRFIDEAAAKLGLRNVETLCIRAEDIPHSRRGSFDAALTRAVAPLSVVLEYAMPLLKTGGRSLAWKGAKAMDEAAGALNACSILGCTKAELLSYELSDELSLYIACCRKLRATPGKYPRKNGIPSKNPL